MENDKITYSAHEVAMAFAERQTKRLWILCIILAAIIIISNTIWVYEWTRYDYTSSEVTTYEYKQDGKGINIIGNENEVNNGANSEENSGENEDQN